MSFKFYLKGNETVNSFWGNLSRAYRAHNTEYPTSSRQFGFW